MRASLEGSYFERLYANRPDPWSFATSPYEAEKYARTLGALDRPRYGRALEIGCSIGVFTAALARRCDALLAVDVSAIALGRATERCAALANVHFERRSLPREFPAGAFDLVTMCEVGYYFDARDAADVRDRIAAALAPGGTLVLAHWLPHVDDYLDDGDGVHARYLADARFATLGAARRERYRLDALRRA